MAFDGRLEPRRLPRHGTVSAAFSFAAAVVTTDHKPVPQLERIILAINRNGTIDPGALPRCHLRQIQPATSAEALEGCHGSLVGVGSFRAHVVLPEQSPFPSAGKIYAFSGIAHHRPVIFAHIYGERPLPISRVLTFAIRRSEGSFATVLSARLPNVSADWGFVTDIDIRLGRRAGDRGSVQGFLRAGCPAPAGFAGAVFTLLRVSFAFTDGRAIDAALARSCAAIG